MGEEEEEERRETGVRSPLSVNQAPVLIGFLILGLSFLFYKMEVLDSLVAGIPFGFHTLSPTACQ